MQSRKPPIMITSIKNTTMVAVQKYPKGAGYAPDYDFQFKIAIVGGKGVGKTSLMYRFVDGVYTDQYVSNSTDYKASIRSVGDKGIRFQVWNIYNEQVRKIVAQHYRAEHAYLVAFDLSKRESFEKVNDILKEIENSPANSIIILVGTKADVLPHAVGQDEVENFINSCGFPISAYIVTSAKEKNYNVDVLFEVAAKLILEQMLEHKEHLLAKPDTTSLSASTSAAPASGLWSRVTSFFSSSSASSPVAPLKSPTPSKP